MKFLIDLMPFVCFYIAYKLFGFYIATAVIIVACSIQTAIQWFISRKLEKLQIIVLVLIWVFGGTSLLLHDPIFLQYKVSIFYWIMGIIFFYTHYFSKQRALQYVLDKQIDLPEKIWRQLNLSWAIFFTLMGFINLYVIYHFSMDAWVNFKMFGTLIMTFIFIIFQSIYMAKHIIEPKEQTNE
tara:strand:- start:106 stop:654 length:549 start_codon:yes stop_codon:yes gene_type:complete